MAELRLPAVTSVWTRVPMVCLHIFTLARSSSSCPFYTLPSHLSLKLRITDHQALRLTNVRPETPIKVSSPVDSSAALTTSLVHSKQVGYAPAQPIILIIFLLGLTFTLDHSTTSERRLAQRASRKRLYRPCWWWKEDPSIQQG
jgi:hypothetical protein